MNRSANSPNRFARLAFNPWSWVALSLALRLGLLLFLPLKGSLITSHDFSKMKRVSPERPGWIQFLQRRTEWQPLDQDERAYDDIGQNVAAGRGFRLNLLFMINTPGEPTMFAGLTYPALLGGLYRLFGLGNQLPVYLLQILMHGLAAWFLFQAAARVGGRVAGAVAAAYFTFQPSLLWVAVSLMTESIMIPLVAATLWLLVDRRRALPGHPVLRGFLIGLLLVVLAQTRSTFAAFLAAALVFLWWENRHRPTWLARLAPGLMAIAVFAAVTLPWAARNHRVWGRWIPFSTKSAMAYMFNHDRLVVELGAGAVGTPPPVDIYDPQIQSLPNEVARSDRISELFREFVREQPGKFLGLCGVRFCLALLPMRLTSTSFSALVAVWYSKGACLVALAGLTALLVGGRLRWRRLVLRAAPVVALLFMWQGLQTLAGTGMRYRMPAEPAWIIFFGVAVAILLNLGPLARRWRKRSR